MKVSTLLYHDVVEKADPESSGFGGPGAAVYKLDAELFDRHLSAIAARVKSAPVRVDSVDPGRAGGLPWMITFDDGGSSAIDPIMPLLGQRSWPGHFLVTASRIGKPGFLDGAELRELFAAGHVIGSHSWSHPPRFSALDQGRMLDEWRRSKAALEDQIGSEVVVASVPGGFYSDAVARAAAVAGIRYLFTSEPVLRTRIVSGCRVLGRFSLRRSSAARLAASFADGAAAPRVAQWIAWNGRKAVKRVWGTRYERIREHWLGRTGGDES